MTIKLQHRIEASFRSLALVWLLSGITFCLLVKGPGRIAAWAVWGSGVFLVGWLIVGVPLIALGNRIFRLPALLLALVGGAAGGILMLSPGLLARLTGPHVHYAPFSLRDLAWPAVAFVTAAAATALYRLLLQKACRPAYPRF